MPQLACNACRHLLPDLESQKEHYRTEWHAYNVKRRCAGMEAVPVTVFEEKVVPVLREAEGDAARANDGTLGFGIKGGKRAVSRVDRAKDHGGHCGPCGKRFSSLNALRQHVNSKRHKEAVGDGDVLEGVVTASGEPFTLETTAASAGGARPHAHQGQGHRGAVPEGVVFDRRGAPGGDASASSSSSSSAAAAPAAGAESGAMDVGGEEEEDDEEAAIEAYLANVERLKPTDCAFCGHVSGSFEATLQHLTSAHSFFFPDVRYVRDLQALYLYVCDKVTVGRTCLTCGRGFGSVRAVRDHMEDKAHGKLPLSAGGGGGDPDDDINDGDDPDASGEGCGEYEEFYDYSQMETVSGAPGHPDEMPLTAYTKRRPVGMVEGGFGIRLDDGSTIGHRDLRRYYRQNISSEGTGGVSDDARVRIVTELRQRYRMLGLADTAGRQRETPKASLRINAKRHMQVGIKANKLQHFFRLQNPY